MGSLWGVVVPWYLSSLSPAVLDVGMRAHCHPTSMVCHCPLPGFFRTCVLKLMHPKSLSHLDPPAQEGLRSTQLGLITKGWFCLPSKPELLGGRGATEGGVTLVPIPVLGPSTSECLLIHFQEEKSTASFQRWSLQASDRPQDTGPCAGP